MAEGNELAGAPADLAERLQAASMPLMEEWLTDIKSYGSVELKAVSEDDLRVYAYMLVRNVVDFVAREMGVEMNNTGTRDFKAEYLASTSALVDAIDAQSSYTEGRSKRVAQFAARLASLLDLTDAQISDIEYAARICNLGLINASQRVFNTPRRLSSDELAMARNHAQVGADMMKPLEFLSEISAMVRYHHANWDGTGYPPGVAKNDIPLGSRIIRIADAFEAMTSERPQRTAMSRDDALSELRREAGKAFDPGLMRYIGAM